MALVGSVLHAGGDQPMASKQVPFEALVCEEAELALLAVERWTVVDHLRMNLYLSYHTRL